jgi:tetratricopeptide (TPR) repeat protein
MKPTRAPQGICPGGIDFRHPQSRFESLAAAARAAAGNRAWDQASQHAGAALALWRGEPLADAGSAELAARETPRLEELRMQALEVWADAKLCLGGHIEVLPELRHQLRAHPLREHLHALLMLALHRSGRQGEAMAAYQNARRILVKELGTEPGAELRELHRQILTDDPALAAPGLVSAQPVPDKAVSAGPVPGATDAVPLVVPRQLPGMAAHFTGRTAELAELDGILEQADGRQPGTVVISAIGGMAGVGKTALAVRWAHQAADRFPGGQLYVDLRGFTPSASPTGPAEAIRGFLDALGVPAERIPLDLAAQAGLYRSLLADRKILIVLDNARDEEQVRPLLPPGPGCLVIVTSRNGLTGLAAAEGASLLSLDVLSDAEARQMLSVRLGADRANAEPDAIADIVRVCGRLPLALAVAAARATTRPALPLPALAAELRDAQVRLDALDTGDPAASIRTVFSWSYQGLSGPAQRMFRLLGLHPGPDITGPATASLAGITPPQARRLLAELARAHLITEHAAGRYTFHDLLRAYATEQAHTSEDDQARHTATGRILDHCLHTAYHASLLVNPQRDPITLPPLLPGVTPEQAADSGEALAWFEAEHKTLMASVSLAGQAGFDSHAWRLAWAVTLFLEIRGYWHDEVSVQRCAIAAVERTGDAASRAVTYRLAGAIGCRGIRDYGQAHAYLMTALDLYRELGDRIGEARTHQHLSIICEELQRLPDARDHCEQALMLLQQAGHRPGEAQALNALGWMHILLGEPQQGRALCRQALTLCRELGERFSESHTLDSLGYAEHLLGRHQAAAACYDQAISLAREIRYRFQKAETLIHLGDTRLASANPHSARQAWVEALAILENLQHPDADRVRTRLGTELPALQHAGTGRGALDVAEQHEQPQQEARSEPEDKQSKH